ncbi:MAG: metallophosphatase family protein [Planctomycetota bacterium]|nr:metallophosphatase family protein [Planctomycetota bacterium]
MRYAIFGDIHGNFDALEAVLEFLDKQDIDVFLCTGDVVGYGAEPSKCIQTVRERCVITLAGNHDHAACGKLDTEFFNIFARQVANWTKQHLSKQEQAWLADLPFVCHFEDFTLSHGSAHSPEVFNYITTIFDAELSFECLDKPLLFYGHTHIPLAFFDTVPMTYTMDQEIKINPEGKTLINVGSVGQPRDEDPRASFAIYDSDQQLVQLHRLPYDVKKAGQKIIDAGLPEALAIRLELGK